MPFVVPSGKDIQFVAQASYTAPSRTDIQLDALFRRIYLTESIVLTDTEDRPLAEVWDGDTMTMSDALIYLLIIGAPEFWPPYMEDEIALSESAHPIASVEMEDSIRFGELIGILATITGEDSATLTEELKLYYKQHGEPWGFVEGKLTKYQER